MHGIIPPDPETQVSQIHYAVVYVPRRSRNRFAANCVEIVVDRKSALEAADADKNRYAVKVAGPSKSSEGQYIYYLLEWLK